MVTITRGTHIILHTGSYDDKNTMGVACALMDFDPDAERDSFRAQREAEGRDARGELHEFTDWLVAQGKIEWIPCAWWWLGEMGELSFNTASSDVLVPL